MLSFLSLSLSLHCKKEKDGGYVNYQVGIIHANIVKKLVVFGYPFLILRSGLLLIMHLSLLLSQ